MIVYAKKLYKSSRVNYVLISEYIVIISIYLYTGIWNCWTCWIIM